MPFIPHTEQDVRRMLDTLQVDSVDQLFDEIPEHLVAKNLGSIGPGLSEMEMMQKLQERASRDQYQACYLGAGAYDHHIPAAVWDVTTRGEFMTAYTPYQAEASQGTLQLIYEFQSMMTALTALDVSNASLYDGGSALAEAVLMAVRANRKSKSRKVLAANSVHPRYLEATRALIGPQGIELVSPALTDGALQITTDDLVGHADDDYAALVISFPNFFGQLEDVHALTDWAHERGMLVIAVVNPMAIASLTPPGEWGEKGADIAVGDGQPLGLPMASGGPYFGFMCCKQALVRQMPGRIIGQTVDLEGKVGYSLTLQAREQHIRRSKATSNICTNQGLAVTAATIYMALLGAAGLESVGRSSHHNTAQLREMIGSIEGVEVRGTDDFFHEFVVRLPGPVAPVLAAMAAQGVIAGLALSDYGLGSERDMLVCATETKTENDLQHYRHLLQEALAGEA